MKIRKHISFREKTLKKIDTYCKETDYDRSEFVNLACENELKRK